jgi:hypothetical protein
MGSGLPQFGFPRRFAIDFCVLEKRFCGLSSDRAGGAREPEEHMLLFYGYFVQKSIEKSTWSGVG